MTDVEADEFYLDWKQGIRDWERAVLAKRKATRVIWIDRLIGTVAAVLGGLALIDGALSGILLLVMGLLVATQLWGRLYRWLFIFRGAPDALAVAHQTVNLDGVRDVSGQSDQRIPWSAYSAMLHLTDMIVLMRHRGGNTPMLLLHRRGLRDPTRWDALVSFIEHRVPDHPHDARPRTSGRLGAAESSNVS